MGFITVTIFDTVICLVTVELCIAFAVFYAGICTYIKSCIDDVSMVIGHMNVNIDEKLSFPDELMQIIELHANCYR